MDTKFEQAFERIKVHGQDLADKIRELIHEGNVRRIIVKDERGHTYLEIPLTVASIGVIAAPVVAAVGAIAALVAKFDIVVERAPSAGVPHPSGSPATDSSVGATEGKVDMHGTVGQRVNAKGDKLEDEAGTGAHDSQGG
jgi:hypothetical protein